MDLGACLTADRGYMHFLKEASYEIFWGSFLVLFLVCQTQAKIVTQAKDFLTEIFSGK